MQQLGNNTAPYNFLEYTGELVKKQDHNGTEYVGMLKVQSANQCIEETKNMAIPKTYNSGLIYEGETVILYADTNIGKSILAMQMADGMAAGTDFMGLRNEVGAQNVGVYDCELSDMQFTRRYSDGNGNYHKFPQNLYRAIHNQDAHYPDGVGMEEYVIATLEEFITKFQLQVLIIDNITWLSTDTEKAKNATPLMQRLQSLKRKFGITLIILAHTPKRDKSRPISGNDLSGSKMLLNFCDSAFAIGESVQDQSLRYIKQIKQRNTEQLYGGGNVLVYQLYKSGSFLQFSYIGNSTENEHLRVADETEREQLEADVKRLSETEPHLSAYSIAQKLCPPNVSFESFRVKIARIHKKINGGSDGK